MEIDIPELVYRCICYLDFVTCAKINVINDCYACNVITNSNKFSIEINKLNKRSDHKVININIKCDKKRPKCNKKITIFKYEADTFMRGIIMTDYIGTCFKETIRALTRNVNVQKCKIYDQGVSTELKKMRIIKYELYVKDQYENNNKVEIEKAKYINILMNKLIIRKAKSKCEEILKIL